MILLVILGINPISSEKHNMLGTQNFLRITVGRWYYHSLSSGGDGISGNYEEDKEGGKIGDRW